MALAGGNQPTFLLFLKQITSVTFITHVVSCGRQPENILCVSRVTNKVKIIDFGLARK